VAGRLHPLLKDQLGLYLNMLALRNHVDIEQNWAALYGDILQTTREAYENDDYPFDELVSQLKLERDTSRNHLFDVLLLGLFANVR
jgi:microcystin synthetase protein McyE